VLEPYSKGKGAAASLSSKAHEAAGQEGGREGRKERDREGRRIRGKGRPISFPIKA